MYASLRTRLVNRNIGSVFDLGNDGTSRRVEDLSSVRGFELLAEGNDLLLQGGFGLYWVCT